MSRYSVFLWLVHNINNKAKSNVGAARLSKCFTLNFKFSLVLHHPNNLSLALNDFGPFLYVTIHHQQLFSDPKP